ncbi:MAG: ISAs1 family transposase [Candidatus Dependentiae bacterium]
MNSISLENVHQNPRFANLISCILEVEDFRSDRNKVYSLECIIILAICALLGGANNIVEIANFGNDHKEWFMPLFGLKDRMPSHDTINAALGLVLPQQLELWLTIWLEGADNNINDHIKIDGKVIRTYSSDDPLCIVRGWIDRLKVVVGSVRVAKHSNEITAIPTLLDKLCLKGKIVTIDAIGAQKNIVSKIRAHGTDYLITLKGNQHQFYKDVKDYLIDVSEKTFDDIPANYSWSEDCDHGRREVREYWATDDIGWLEQKPEWAGLRNIALVKSTVVKKGKQAVAMRCYISSLPPHAARILCLSRAHWSIENKLHWHLDTAMDEDRSTIRKFNTPMNMSALRCFSLSKLHKSPINRSIQGKRNMITTSQSALWETLIN